MNLFFKFNASNFKNMYKYRIVPSNYFVLHHPLITGYYIYSSIYCSIYYFLLQLVTNPPVLTGSTFVSSLHMLSLLCEKNPDLAVKMHEAGV